MPATADPKVTKPGTTPAWMPGNWPNQGWSFRMEFFGITHATVLGAIDSDDVSNAGHLDCVAILCSDGKVRVTSKRWLVVA